MVPRFAPGTGAGVDFLGYWSASRLMVQRGDPYNHDAMALMQSANRPPTIPRAKDETPVVVWDPPWLNLVLAPLTVLSFQAAAATWMFVNIAFLGLALLLSLRLLHAERDEGAFLWGVVATMAFGGTLALVKMGQIGTLVLMSLLLSLWLRQIGREWLAGAVLLLACIKPHLSYLVILMLVADSLRTRRFRLVGGLVIAVVASTLVSWIFFPRWLGSYLGLLGGTPFREVYTSTVGSFATHVLHWRLLRHTWVLVLPLAWPLLRVAEREGWMTATNIALLVSVPLAPFGYTFDQVVLLPALIQMVVWLTSRRGARSVTMTCLAALVAIYAGYWVLLSNGARPYYWFFWVPLALLVVYLVLRATVASDASTSPPASKNGAPGTLT